MIGASVEKQPRLIGPAASFVILEAKSYKSFDCWRIDLVALANFSPPGVRNKPLACFLTNNCIENSCSSCDIAADMDGEDMFNCFAARDTLLVSVTVKKYLSCFNENLNLCIHLVLYPNSF